MGFFCILVLACVTSPPSLAIYHPVRNLHTGWMIPAITLKTLHILLGSVLERRNNSIPGIKVPYFRDNFIPGINSVPERRNSAIQGINLG